MPELRTLPRNGLSWTSPFARDLCVKMKIPEVALCAAVDMLPAYAETLNLLISGSKLHCKT